MMAHDDAKEISVLNTIVKYFYHQIIELNYNVDQYCNSLIWPNNFYTRCAKPEAVARRWPVKKLFIKILQNSQENTCTRSSLEILLKRDFNKNVFLWISEIFKNTLFNKTPPVSSAENNVIENLWKRKSMNLLSMHFFTIFTKLSSL